MEVSHLIPHGEDQAVVEQVVRKVTVVRVVFQVTIQVPVAEVQVVVVVEQ
jgi:hypothetical protein